MNLRLQETTLVGQARRGAAEERHPPVEECDHERDERGFILTGPDLIRDGRRPKGWTLDRDPFLLETNIAGIFAVGDVRHGSIKRVASGVGEGSVAVQFIHQYLSKV